MSVPSITTVPLPKATPLVGVPSDISNESLISEMKALQEKIHTLENTNLGDILYIFRNEKPDGKLSDEQIIHILHTIVNLPENEINLYTQEIIQCSQTIAICKMALVNRLKIYEELSDNLKLLDQKHAKEEALFNDELKKREQDFSLTQTTLNEKKEAAETLKKEINLLNNQRSKEIGIKSAKKKINIKKPLLTKLNEEINQLSQASRSQEQQLSQFELNYTINLKGVIDQLNSWRAQLKKAQDKMDQSQNQIEKAMERIEDIFSKLDRHLVSDKLSEEREKLQAQLAEFQAEAQKRKIEFQ